MSRRIRLDLQYVGTRYAGWQLQRDRPTIQGTLESALAEILRAPVRVQGAGRTDAGAHARGQVAHFETGAMLAVDRIQSGGNHFLPQDIRIVSAREVPDHFHARRSALSKEYRYRVYRGTVMPPHIAPYALLVEGELDVEAMRRAATRLVGTHDFGPFRCAGSSAETTVRTVMRSDWIEEAPELVYAVEADGFLYKMVRTIVGWLLEIGRGRQDGGGLDRPAHEGAFAARGPLAVPAHGLHLWRVNYETVRPIIRNPARIDKVNQ